MTTPRSLAGRYEIGEILGFGGMSEVHRGRDTVLGRDVAVKIMRSELARDDAFYQRFRREAQNSASLGHPSIVAIFDTGEEQVPDGTLPYIVMELVEGETVRDIVRTHGAMDPERALGVMADVCGAIDFSHRKGIIHRDVKPANIMITDDGAVKVMDFGIARAVSESTSTLTQTSSVLGTAQYLSPEQARGESVDPRSDVYSAGCVLYEMLTGVPPFTGESPVAVAYQHVREDPRIPSSVNPALGPYVDAIVMQSMAKNPENRYASAGDMRSDLLAVLAGRRPSAPLVLSDDDLDESQRPDSDHGFRGAGFSSHRAGWGRDALGGAAVGAGALGAGALGAGAAHAAGRHADRGYDDEPATEMHDFGGIGSGRGNGGAGAGGAGAAAPTAGAGIPAGYGTDYGSNGGRGGRGNGGNNPGGPVGPGAGLSAGANDPDGPDGRTGRDGRRSQKKRRRPAAVALAALAVIALVIGLVYWGMSGGDDADGGDGPGPVQEVTIPEVAQRPVQEVVPQLEALGLKVVQQQQPDPQIAAGLVISSDPIAGKRLPRDSEIHLVVSSGKPIIGVPNVMGMSGADAQRALQDAGLTVNPQHTSKPSTAEDSGKVVATDPGPGAQIPSDRPVTLTVGSGPEEISVPNVVGQNVDSARSALEGAGFRVDTTEVDSSEPAGQVLSQSTAGGQSQIKGATIDLRVSAGNRFQVPNLVNMTVQEATDALRRAGWKGTREQLVELPQNDPDLSRVGKIFSQQPPTGEAGVNDQIVVRVIRFGLVPGPG